MTLNVNSVIDGAETLRNRAGLFEPHFLLVETLHSQVNGVDFLGVNECES